MRVIKKYPNRRLYDTEKSAYITLVNVHELIRQGVAFKVVDAESGEDITRAILIQIIIEQENGDTPIFTTEMLTKFIRFYDEPSQGIFGEFLEKNLQIFLDQQKRFQQQVEGLLESPVSRVMQEMTERNLEMWQAMQKRFFDLATAKPQRDDTAEDDSTAAGARRSGKKRK